jgi:hypothetical protein
MVLVLTDVNMAYTSWYFRSMFLLGAVSMKDLLGYCCMCGNLELIILLLFEYGNEENVISIQEN